nr:E3 ubiquitin-protein ligase Midline-1-like [Lytechinus pictus]
MAEKCGSEKASNSSPNLICPLCLDIFVEATILTSCGHIFCRRCLKKYDLTHQDLDHMVCPLCREITKLSTNRVDDLRLHASINGCVDDYHAKCGGMNAVLEMCQKCTACKSLKDAVSFCRTCNYYMCDECLHCHQHLTVVFEGHEIVSMDDVIEGKVSIRHLFEKCSIHKQENKDMFCDDCKVHVCHKCVLVGHKAHEIKNQIDFEQELRRKVTDLAQRCAEKKAELEKNIQNIEIQRNEVHTTVQTLLDDVRQAYSIKAKELEENLRNLTDQIHALEHSFDDDLDALKSKDRQRIKSICSSITLVDNDRLGHLETDTLSAHILLCEELDAMLKEVSDHTSAEAIKKKAQEKRDKREKLNKV